MLSRDTIDWLIEHLTEHQWLLGEEQPSGRYDNYCPVCNWHLSTDQKPGEHCLRHRPGCRLVEVLAELKAE